MVCGVVLTMFKVQVGNLANFMGWAEFAVVIVIVITEKEQKKSLATHTQLTTHC